MAERRQLVRLSTPCNGFHTLTVAPAGNPVLSTPCNGFVEYYLPILDWNEDQVNRFIEEKSIPHNPAWDFGWSFECLCLAGTTIKKLDEIIAKAPELAKWLSEKDREIQWARRSGPGYLAPLLDKKMTLHEYIERKLRQPKLTQYIELGIKEQHQGEGG